jgi:hypothetical protein
MVAHRRAILWALGFAVAFSGTVLAAQDAPVPTLHVYANLIQIPVLVLDWAGDALQKPVDARRFYVSVDSGPWFRATHARLEADDPISLTILLDTHGDAAELMPKMEAAMATLPLRSHDHVTIYALDCTLQRSLNDRPAEQGTLKAGVAAALQPWADRRKEKHRDQCKSPVHLWDALNFAVWRLDQLPGRRVILAVTDGIDAGSVHPWQEVMESAEHTGTAIFGMTSVAMPGPYRPRAFMRDGTLITMCETSGGMVFATNGRFMADDLQKFVETLRSRYVVEFPRPNHSTAGAHQLDVKVEKGNYFIWHSGITVPTPDPAVLADPTTVPSDPSLAPEEGTRRILAQPK